MTKIGKLEVLVGPGTAQGKEHLIEFGKRKASTRAFQELYFEAFEQHLYVYALYGEKIMTPKQIMMAAEEVVEQSGGRMTRPGVRMHKYEIAQAMLEHAGLTELAAVIEGSVEREKQESGGFKGCLWAAMYAKERW